MTKKAGKSSKKPTRSGGSNTWQLQDAKARFSQVVRRAQRVGPQHVTVRGKDAVVVLSAKDARAISGKRSKKSDFLSFMESIGLARLEVVRDDDRGRDVDL